MKQNRGTKHNIVQRLLQANNHALIYRFEIIDVILNFSERLGRKFLIFALILEKIEFPPLFDIALQLLHALHSKSMNDSTTNDPKHR